MLSELTSRILKDPRVQNELIRKRTSLVNHPRLRLFREAIEALPDKPLSSLEFGTAVEGSPNLEKIVGLLNRPALFVKNDTFEVPIADYWHAQLNAASTSLERAIRAVGRIEISQPDFGGYIGTGWVIAPGVLVTNRHVALEFIRRRNDGTFILRTNEIGQVLVPVVDFKEEYMQPVAPLEFQLDRVLLVMEDDNSMPDIAFLGIKQGADPIPDPIPLAELTLTPGRPVAAIGYPAYDKGEADRAAMIEIFGGIFDVKRLSPGEIMVPPMQNRWFFEHDCTTLGGNSGSVILDLQTGGAVGLHFSGRSRTANYAVGVEALKKALDSIPGLKKRPNSVPDMPVGPRAEPTADEEKAGKPSDYANRDGYQPDFLLGGVVAPLPTVAQSRQAEIALRTDAGSTAELTYRHFSVIVNGARRFPMITGVNIDGTSLKRVPKKKDWRIDPRIAPEHQVGNTVYANNNLDKGHMVRRLDPVWGGQDEAQEGNDDTFHYTNACPQDHTFNDVLWGNLEDYILDSAPDDERLCVYTGPVLAADDPEYRGIQIPRSFWKVVVWRKGTLKTAGFLLTQEEYISNLEFNPYQFGSFQVTLCEIQDKAGVDFGILAQADVLAGQEATLPRRALTSVEEIRI